MKTFGGPAVLLDRNDINTDEIIPAKYLTEITKVALKPHLLEDLLIDGKAFDSHSVEMNEAKVVVTKANFGCGSSREHAVWAFEVNDINVVIASSFARIFRQNMFNCGMMAVELPAETIDRIFTDFVGKETYLETHLEKNIFIITAKDLRLEVCFSISDFDRALVGPGVVEYADSRY